MATAISASTITILLLGGVLALAPPGAASHACGDAEAVGANAMRTGNVAAGDHWYGHSAAGPARYVLYPDAGTNVDLDVFTSDCSTRLCPAASALRAAGTEECTLPPGSYRIQVHHVSGAGGYIITFAGQTGVPVNLLPFSQSQPISPISTPNVPPTPVTTPPVAAPATCTVAVCTSPTPIAGTQTPPIPQKCVPPIICLGPVSPQPLTPPVTVPALCALAGPICLPPTTILGSQTVTVPGQGPVPLTPAIVVTVSSTGFNGLVDSHLGESTIVGPIETQVGPVPVTLFPGGLPVPMPPGAGLVGDVTITVTVGAQTFTRTVPVVV